MRRSTWSLALPLVAMLLPQAALAQRSRRAASPVVRVLQSAPDARSRAQAALTLGELGASEAMPALQAALADTEAPVRASAAAALAMLGSAVALPALQSHLEDPDADVRAAVSDAVRALQAPPQDWNQARFVVGAGALADNTRNDPARVRTMHRGIHESLRGRPTLVVRDGALPPVATARLRRGALRAYSLDGGLNRLVRLQQGDGPAVRAEVTFVIVAQPARAIVGMVQGAATARMHPGASEQSMQDAERTAIESAVRGALRDIEQALPHALR
jgi:HEAT repeat protein